MTRSLSDLAQEAQGILDRTPVGDTLMLLNSLKYRESLQHVEMLLAAPQYATPGPEVHGDGENG